MNQRCCQWHITEKEPLGSSAIQSHYFSSGKHQGNKHWARIVLRWELLVLLTKPNQAALWEHVCQADGWHILLRSIGSGKVLTACGWTMLSGPQQYWQLEFSPTIWSHENGQSRGSCRAKKIWWIGRLQVQNLFMSFLCGISIKIYLPLVICIHYVKQWKIKIGCLHIFLHARDVT